MSRRALCSIVLVSALFLIPARFAFAQLDQGTITGIVQDQTGAVVSGASVTLTNVDEGSVLKTRSDHSGIYVFSPIKIGSYSVSASAPGFATTTQTNLHLNIQQRLNVVIALKAGTTTETITVTTEEPLMQTQERLCDGGPPPAGIDGRHDVRDRDRPDDRDPREPRSAQQLQPSHVRARAGRVLPGLHARLRRSRRGRPPPPSSYDAGRRHVRGGDERDAVRVAAVEPLGGPRERGPHRHSSNVWIFFLALRAGEPCY